MKRLMTGALAISALLWMGVAQANAPAYPSPDLAQIMKTGKYMGPDSCLECHEDEHKAWHGSRHTIKTQRGPAFGKEYEKNIYEWVRRDWDKLDTYMIVDTKDAKTNYMAARKVQINEITFITGQTYKQRYMAYYDGGPLEVYEATTADGGISWRIDKTKTTQFAGNKDRAGYKFLYLEMNPKDGTFNKNNYGEWRSWQERCIACHVTGFDRGAWDQAKADFKAGKRADLRDTFSSDIRISCEACHGPGEAHVKQKSKKNNILNPAKITDVEARKMVCEQCHTRTQASTHSPLAQDLRGYRPMDKYEDFAIYTRPAWGKGNRQVSIDGKGRRDHQQDMDMRLSATIKGPHSTHAAMACFDCHEQHAIGKPGRKNPTLKAATPRESCVSCHGAQSDAVLKVMNGRAGWEAASFGKWGTPFGRQANKQHIFNIEQHGRSFGVNVDKYHWALKKGGDARKEADWDAIWPWEKAQFEKQGRTTAVGPAPWN